MNKMSSLINSLSIVDQGKPARTTQWDFIWRHLSNNLCHTIYTINKIQHHILNNHTVGNNYIHELYKNKITL